MAAETENTKKPKVELIKRAKTDVVTSDPAAETAAASVDLKQHVAVVPVLKPETQERKKVVKIVKKKAAAVPKSAPEKPAAKIAVAAKSDSDSGVQDNGKTSASAEENKKDIAPAAEVSVGSAQESGGNSNKESVLSVSTEHKNEEKPKKQASDVSEKKPVEQDIARSGAVSYVAPTQRPAVQVGRVGGKFFGPKRTEGEPNKEGSGSRRGGYAGRNNFRSGNNDSGTSSGAVEGGGVRPSTTAQGGPYRQGGYNNSGGYRPAGAAGHSGGGQGGYRPAQGGYRPAGTGGYRPAGAAGAGGAYRPNNSGGYRPAAGGQGGYRPGGAYRPGGQGAGGLRAGGFGNRPGAPAITPIPADGKTPSKRAFKAKKPAYTKKDKELEMEEKLLQTKKRITQVANPVPKSIDIMEVVSVSELARKMNLKASDLIAKLMSMGQLVTINQQIDSETATILAAEFGADVNIVSLYDETLIETESDDDSSKLPCPPVVTVMGHVDHGKTKLLDAIRSADVVSGEFGGITQHIGAYMVETTNGNITFLDTPGHEAFTRMRSRGAQVTDIVVLVVAADDGVMPQTIEAMNHAKEAEVPIIVAVNKIDKPEANPDKVKAQLADLGLQPEDWGGQTMFVELSALKKTGLDKLIEAILLQAEILDLRSNYNRSAEGKVLESRIDHGRGIVATIIVEKGTLEIGDSFVAGVWPGKVRAIFNDKGKRIERATPAMPVEVLGFEGIPNAGDPLQVVEDEKIARGISAKRQELKRFEDAKNITKITLETLGDTIREGEMQELKVIIKGDVQGSVEALKSSLEKLSTKEIRLHVIQSLPGAINEGDVNLAAASNAILIGFNVRPTPKAKALADQEKVDVRRYNVIYKVVEEIQQAMEGMLKPDTKEQVTGNVEVRQVFKISKSGIIAGCYVQSGVVKRSSSVNVIRNDTVIFTGKIASLRRIKDDVKEVNAGFECGIGIEEWEDIKEGDEFEIFEIVEVARKL
ncbi:MAG: translation initiation factor IF-2 [Termitinemataceae bacterium]|nr:MAG: translation initiation factor IF-2 [Termitinemataceae bacterium]